MYRVINTQEDLSTFQSDINKISDWCKMNRTCMDFKDTDTVRTVYCSLVRHLLETWNPYTKRNSDELEAVQR